MKPLYIIIILSFMGCSVAKNKKDASLETFPIQKLRPISTTLSGEDGDVSLEIKLEPFDIKIGDFDEHVDTTILLDLINIPTSPEKLEGKTFTFPINPEAGYIEGSIYLYNAHNLIDVTRITFGKYKDNTLPMSIQTHWLMETGFTDFPNFEKVIETNLTF